VTARALPLRGIRVVNFGVGGVAPWAASQLAQLGATVVKIEAPNEFIMYTLPPWRGLTTTYAALNANSRSVKLNLKDEGDRQLARQLVDSADVMIENFRSGAIDRMGFGFDVVAVESKNADVDAGLRLFDGRDYWTDAVVGFHDQTHLAAFFSSQVTATASAPCRAAIASEMRSVRRPCGTCAEYAM
jgi:hypothetical protein